MTKTQSKYFGSKIRVFKFGSEKRLKEVPSYVIIMLNEVKNRVVNEEVKRNFSGLMIGLNAFCVRLLVENFMRRIYNVVRGSKTKPLFLLNYRVIV